MTIGQLPATVILIFDHDLRYQAVSGSGLADQLFNQRAEMGKIMMETMPLAYVAMFEAPYRAALTGQQQALNFGFAAMLYRIQVGPLRDAEGQIIGGMAVSMPIDQPETHIPYSQRYRALFDQTNDGVFILDMNGYPIEWNSRIAEMLGYTHEEMAGVSIYTVATGQEFIDSQQRLARVQAGEELPLYERRFLRKDGTYLTVEVNLAAVKDEQGRPQHLMSVIRDITARKQAEQALRRSEERFRLIVSVISDGVYDWDMVNNIDWHSDWYEKTFSSDPQLQGFAAWFDRIHPDERDEVVNSQYEALRDGSESWAREYRMRRSDGGYATVADRAIIMRDASGSPVRLVGVVADITERRAVEQQTLDLTLQKEKIRLLTDFITAVSHDFRTPLSIINTSIYLLTRTPNPADQQRHLGKLEEQVSRIEQLVDGLLTMARLDQENILTFEWLDLNFVIRYLELQRRAVFEAKNLVLQVQLDSELPPAYVDRYWLHQALLNIIDNAIQYTPSGGVVTLRTYRETTFIVVEIQDTGIGIHAEALNNVFDPLYRAEEHRPMSGGPGLGLAIARRIIELHGGQIVITSEFEVGTTVRVYVHTDLKSPIARSSAPQNVLY